MSPAFSFLKAHFLKCLRQAVTGFQAGLVSMSHGDIVEMKMRSCFIQMKNGIEQKKIRIPILEGFSILIEYMDCLCSIFCQIPC